MKKSITFLALAFLAFTNVTLASHSVPNANHSLTENSFSNNGSGITLSKFVRVTAVEPALSKDVENLRYRKSINEIIANDIKVTESNVVFDTDPSDVEQLKYTRTIEDVINDNLQITEGLF